MKLLALMVIPPMIGLRLLSLAVVELEELIEQLDTVLTRVEESTR